MIGKRSVCLVPLWSVAAFGQETAKVTWDPREVGYPLYSWQGLSGLLLGAVLLMAYLYVYWRVLSCLVKRFRDRSGWAATRYWLPSAMLIVAAALLSVAVLGFELLADALFLFVGPLFLVAYGGVAYLGLRGWLAIVPASVLFWWGWHFLVRFAELRLDEVEPGSLHIT